MAIRAQIQVARRGMIVDDSIIKLRLSPDDDPVWNKGGTLAWEEFQD
jgi:hypothetical protein